MAGHFMYYDIVRNGSWDLLDGGMCVLKTFPRGSPLFNWKHDYHPLDLHFKVSTATSYLSILSISSLLTFPLYIVDNTSRIPITMKHIDFLLVTLLCLNVLTDATPIPRRLDELSYSPSTSNGEFSTPDYGTLVVRGKPGGGASSSGKSSYSNGNKPNKPSSNNKPHSNNKPQSNNKPKSNNKSGPPKTNSPNIAKPQTNNKSSPPKTNSPNNAKPQTNNKPKTPVTGKNNAKAAPKAQAQAPAPWWNQLGSDVAKIGSTIGKDAIQVGSAAVQQTKDGIKADVNGVVNGVEKGVSGAVKGAEKVLNTGVKDAGAAVNAVKNGAQNVASTVAKDVPKVIAGTVNNAKAAYNWYENTGQGLVQNAQNLYNSPVGQKVAGAVENWGKNTLKLGGQAAADGAKVVADGAKVAADVSKVAQAVSPEIQFAEAASKAVQAAAPAVEQAAGAALNVAEAAAPEIGSGLLEAAEVAPIALAPVGL
jgi:hypothetical protein